MKRAALWLVPRAWRAAVAHDLDQERETSDRSRGTLWFAAHAARAGLRLRAAHAADRLLRRHGLPRPRQPLRLFSDAGRDVRLAVRRAVSRPGYAVGVVGMLALGIGANTAIYSVFNWVLFRPLPGAANPSELVTIRFQPANREVQLFVSYRDYADLRDGIAGVTGVSASAPMAVDLAVPGVRDPRRTDAEIVTSNYFKVFGVTPAPGRDFSTADERPSNTPPAAIISRRLWRSLFDRDPSAVGRPLVINGQSFVVAGVTPAGFQGRSLVTATDIWLPMGAHPQLLHRNGPDVLTKRQNPVFGDAFARLRPGVSLAVVQAQAIAAAKSSGDFMGSRGRRMSVEPVVYEGVGQETYAKARLAVMFNLVMGAVALVLLLACANAANLLLARALGRRREIALCQAIGASRFRIVRQQLIEGLVLASAAGALGLLIAAAITSLFDGMRLLSFLPAVSGVSLDARVLTFALLTSVATGVLFATAPAFLSSRVDLNASLKDGLTSSRSGRRVARATLATLQVAICAMLLVGAGLFIRTMNNIRAIDLGMRIDGVVTYAVNPPGHGITGARGHQYFRDTLDRLRAAPGVTSVAYSWTTPYLQMRDEETLTAEGGDRKVDVAANTVSPGYFDTLGIPLLAGRDFRDDEVWREDGPAVGIVSERLARALWPAGNGGVGSRVVLEYPKGKVLQIVGIVGDVRGRPLTDEPEPYFYTPADQPWGRVHVRSSLPLAQTMASIRDVARDLNAALPPYELEPFSATIDRVLAEQRVLARLSGLFALLATVLAGMGLYAMMAGAVTERMREFGIRLALGARAGGLLHLVMRSALFVTIVGLAAGLVAALLASRFVASRLYGVAPHDPITLAAASALLIALALVATAIPAMRATRADPVRSLRTE